MKSSQLESPPRITALGEHLAYGLGTLLLAVGPVLAGMDMITWMAIYMGINAAVLIGICLLGIRYSLGGGQTRSRRRG